MTVLLTVINELEKIEITAEDLKVRRQEPREEERRMNLNSWKWPC